MASRIFFSVIGMTAASGGYVMYLNQSFSDPMQDIIDGRLATSKQLGDPAQQKLGGYPMTFYSEHGIKEPHDLQPALHTHRSDVVDVCIIGGGFAGLHTALALAEKSKKCVVLEASRVGSGASGRNGGDAIIGFHVEAEELGTLLGDEKAKTLYSHAVLGYDRLKKVIKDYKIKCDPQEVGAVTCMFSNRVEGEKVPIGEVLQKEQEWAAEQKAKYGEEVEVWSKEKLESKGLKSSRYAYGIFNPRSITLNPLELVLGLARACRERGVTIHEGSPVVNCVKTDDHFVVTTAMGSIKAKDVVVATASAPLSIFPKLALCTTPLYTAMMLTRPLPKNELDAVMTAKCAIFDERFALAYFRRVSGDRLLYGSLATPTPMRRATFEHKLKEDLGKTFPSLARFVEVEASWQGRLEAKYPIFPMIGRDVGGSGVWYSLGFSGHGLVPTCAAGELLASAIASIPPTCAAREAADTRYKLWSEVALSPSFQVDPKRGYIPPAMPPLLGPFGSVGAYVFCGVLGLSDYLSRKF